MRVMDAMYSETQRLWWVIMLEAIGGSIIVMGSVQMVFVMVLII